MHEHSYTIDGHDAARIARTLKHLAMMMLANDDEPMRLTDDQMMVITAGHAVANDRSRAAALMVRTAEVIENQMTDDDPEV